MILRLQDDQGLHFAGVLVSAAVTTIILLGLYVLLETGLSTPSRGEQKLDIQQGARAAMDTMTRDLRMAGSGLPNPHDYHNSPTAFAAATASSISFLTDPLNANSVLTTNAAAGATTISVSSTTNFQPWCHPLHFR